MGDRVQLQAKTSEVKRENAVLQTRRPGFSQFLHSPVEHLLTLQQTIGNQTVQRLLHFRMIQLKLKISSPNDKYEQKADRIDQVMWMQVPLQRCIRSRVFRTLLRTGTGTGRSEQFCRVSDILRHPSSPAPGNNGPSGVSLQSK